MLGGNHKLEAIELVEVPQLDKVYSRVVGLVGEYLTLGKSMAHPGGMDQHSPTRPEQVGLQMFLNIRIFRP